MGSKKRKKQMPVHKKELTKGIWIGDKVELLGNPGHVREVKQAFRDGCIILSDGEVVRKEDYVKVEETPYIRFRFPDGTFGVFNFGS